MPAYSTLGWTDWLGGDPLLNTFVHWPEGELARLIFHELAHQVAYADDDTTFNESFATAVERIGGRRWLERHATPQARAEYAALDARRQDFRDADPQRRATTSTPSMPARCPTPTSASARPPLLAALRGEYAALKAARWGGFAGYDGWFARANNAAFGVQAAYNELVPAFERLFERSGGDFDRFYAEVQQPGRLAEGRAARQTRGSTSEQDTAPWPTSASTANTSWAWPRRARWPGSGPSRWSRSSTWSAP